MGSALLKELFVQSAPPAAGTAPESIQRILHSIRTHLDMDVAFASHVTPGEVLIEHADMGPKRPFATGDSFAPEDGYCQRILDGRLPYLIPDTSRVAEAAALRCTSEMPIGSHLSVPLKLSDGRVYGTFCCFSFRPNRTLNERDLRMMHAFADLAAAQIEAGIDLERHEAETVARVTAIIEKDSLAVVYQPIYQLDSNEVVGVECLARFPDSETRPPSDWFEEAKDVGKGIELELVAIRAALRGLPYLADELYLAINVSPETILSGRVEAALADAPPNRIVLEVTEHAVVKDYVGLERALEPLRNRVRIAVDDAGAGYSGLSHILNIRPDLIKLDMTLTRGIDSDPARSALATALVTFAREIGSRIVAEGVETQAELASLQRLGIDCAQGYYLRRPMPIGAVAQFLMARRLS